MAKLNRVTVPEPYRADLLRYLRALADDMNLRDWRITLFRKTSKRENSGAWVRCTYGRKIIELKLGPGWFEQEPEAQRHYLVHEMLHVHFWPLTVLLADTSQNVGKRWVKSLELNHSRAMEYGIDEVAYIIEQAVPLPPCSCERCRNGVDDAKEIKDVGVSRVDGSDGEPQADVGTLPLEIGEGWDALSGRAAVGFPRRAEGDQPAAEARRESTPEVRVMFRPSLD